MKFSKAEIEALIAAAPRTYIPLNKLVLSSTQQARTDRSTPQLSDEELRASILALGVLQNLIVVVSARGIHEVCAGGRRLQELQALAEAGRIPENYPVPVLIVPADQALMASLSENHFHVPMHPADELAAFEKMVAQGKSIEDVAAAFGVSPLTVKRRLKLANVSPNLMALYRSEDISLDCLMALASVDDHARQEMAWETVPAWNRRPEAIRAVLAQDEIESDTDPVARYVGLAAYEKAGGTLRRDLFSDADKKAYLCDPLLLGRLAVGKLQRRAKQVTTEGWKWVEVRARYVYDEYVQHGELRTTRRAPTEAEAEARATLEARIEAVQSDMEAEAEQDGESDRYEELEREAQELATELRQFDAGLLAWTPEQMAQSGCVVYVGAGGKPAVKCGLIRPDDREQVVQAASGSDDAAARLGLVSVPTRTSRPVHSDKLMRNLSAHRVAAVQAELIAQPHVPIAVLTAQLAAQVFGDPTQAYQLDAPFDIKASCTHHDLRTAAEGLNDTPAWAQIHAEHESWVKALPKQPADYQSWLLTQSPGIVLKLLAYLIAITTTGVYGAQPKRNVNEGLAQALGLDMCRWWHVTGTSYLAHVSKARIVEVVVEAVGVDAAAPLDALKKADAVSDAEQLLAESRWLPPILRVGDEGATEQGTEPEPVGEGEGAQVDDETDDEAMAQAEPAH